MTSSSASSAGTIVASAARPQMAYVLVDRPLDVDVALIASDEVAAVGGEREPARADLPDQPLGADVEIDRAAALAAHRDDARVRAR